MLMRLRLSRGMGPRSLPRSLPVCVCVSAASEDMCLDTQHLLNCVHNLCDIHFQRRDVTKTRGVLDLVHSAESQVPVPCLHTRLQSDADSDSDAFSFKLLAVLDSQSWPVWDYCMVFQVCVSKSSPELWRSNFGDRTDAHQALGQLVILCVSFFLQRSC